MLSDCGAAMEIEKNRLLREEKRERRLHMAYSDWMWKPSEGRTRVQDAHGNYGSNCVCLPL